MLDGPKGPRPGSAALCTLQSTVKSRPAVAATSLLTLVLLLVGGLVAVKLTARHWHGQERREVGILLLTELLQP